ncbi:MAG: hypothetical protein IJR89_07225 [Clostridia bacterium]|nr:hypothetical protein [Clostridia bacterium]
MKTYGLIEKKSFSVRALKWALVFLGYDFLCFALYAMFLGQMITDRRETADKDRALVVYSAVMLCIFLAVLYSLPRRDLSLKTRLIHESDLEGFTPSSYFKATLLSDVLPTAIAAFVTLLPYAIFYQISGFGYERALPVENFFTGHLALMIPLGGILALLIETALFFGVCALAQYRAQKEILAERINRPWEQR